MLNFANLALKVATHPILHTPAFQGIGLGTFLGSLGLHWISNARANGISLQQRIINGALGSLSLFASYSAFGPAVKRIMEHGFSIYIKDGEEPPPRNDLHPYETFIARNWGTALLRLNQSDPKPKILWLVGSWDYNTALNPKHSLDKIAYRVEKYNDFKYKVIDHPQHLCNEIQSAVQIGNLTTLVLHAHGNWGSLHLNEQRNGLSVLQPLPDGCFANVPENVRIILISCATASSFPPLSFAQWLAWTANKTVYGAKDLVSASHTLLTIEQSGELSVDFCSKPVFFSCAHSSSIMQVFSPPKTAYDKIAMVGRIGLSTLGGLFVGSQLIRLSLLPLQLTQKLAFKALGTG